MSTFHHLALNCHDRVAQEAFYAEHFGFHRARTLNIGKPDEFVMLRLGDAWLELFNVDAPGERGLPHDLRVVAGQAPRHGDDEGC